MNNLPSFNIKEVVQILTKDNKWKFMPDICQPIDNEWSYDPTDVTHWRADKNTKIPVKINVEAIIYITAESNIIPFAQLP